MSRLAVSILLGILALVAAGQAGDDAKQKAIKDTWQKRNGTWEPVSFVNDGKETPVPKDGKFVLVYKDETYTDLYEGKVVGEGLSKVDPTQDPKALDILPKVGAGQKQMTILAIYELKDDELRVCMVGPGKERPKEFSAKEGSGQMLFTFKRLKKEVP
jgi:uncharacterized protein (TIGR03067 family)